MSISTGKPSLVIYQTITKEPFSAVQRVTDFEETIKVSGSYLGIWEWRSRQDKPAAVSASSIDAPFGVSEWDITGLTEAPTTTVKPTRVRESIFSIEAKVVDIKEFRGHGSGMSKAAVFLLRATRFWVREDVTNKDASHIDLDKLRPVGQLGGMSYGRVTSTFELPRTKWKDEQPVNKFLSRLEFEETESP